MKAILISIQPKYVADILDGKKTLEIRKTMPKCDLPIDVYIYCTKGKLNLVYDQDYDDKNQTWKKGKYELVDYGDKYSLNGKVVAKFTLNKVEEIIFGKTLYNDLGFFTCGLYDFDLYKQSCLTKKEMQNYLKVKPNGLSGYAWHINNLVLFDKPKELKELYTTNLDKQLPELFDNSIQLPNGTWVKPLTRAPQSWQFIEV